MQSSILSSKLLVTLESVHSSIWDKWNPNKEEKKDCSWILWRIMFVRFIRESLVQHRKRSGTPTSQVCSCKPGYRGTCCEKGKLKSYIVCKQRQNLIIQVYIVNVSVWRVSSVLLSVCAYVNFFFLWHIKDGLWNKRKKVSANKISASRGLQLKTILHDYDRLLRRMNATIFDDWV